MANVTSLAVTVEVSLALKNDVKMTSIPTLLIPSITRCDLTARAVQREFNTFCESAAKLTIAGRARSLDELFARNLRPRHKLELFDTQFFFSRVFQIPELKFFVGYVVQKDGRHRTTIAARVFYKDLSLSWRVASHFTLEDGALWVGKGDVRDEMENGDELIVSNESTTDLPHEMQTAVESLLQFGGKPQGSLSILKLVLKQAPADRVEPYRDFVAPRQAAQSNPRNLVNQGRSIARFQRRNDPQSLKIKKGFEPDFEDGVIERSESKSKLYGGRLRRYRILSANRKVQYYFLQGAKHVWIIAPQALTTELSSYGVRTIDVTADDDLFIPGYEYHHAEETENGVELYSQIPDGFAGDVCEVDDAKADASPWLNQIPVIQEFRRANL